VAIKSHLPRLFAFQANVTRHVLQAG